ncbi:MAG: hypothetical protein ACTSV5_10530 [Promethearchaeota archaeon]
MVIIIPRRKQKIKYSRKFACKFLEPAGNFSNSLQALCVCKERDLVLGRKAYVCQVCNLYSQVSKKFSDVYEESKKIAEQKIKEKQIELDEFELKEISSENELDLSIDEFEEDEEEVPLRFEKRKASKDDLDTEDFGEMECPFCAEIFEDVHSHMESCEFAPDDASIDDFLPSIKKKKKTRGSSTNTTKSSTPKEKQTCPYCGKQFQRLGRHLTSCPKRPKDDDEKNDKE